MKLSIIIPCKKEALNIKTCILRIVATCPTAEILIVDSGLDDTKEIINQLNKKLEANLIYLKCIPDRGKGDAIKAGIAKSTGQIILQIDADLQFYPEDIPSLIEPILNNEADMTLGSRFLASKSNGQHKGAIIRSIGNLFFSLYCTLIYQHKISDALAGFKAWKKDVTQSFELTSYTYTYEIELFAKALRKKWRVRDVSVRYANRLQGQSTVPILITGLRILRDTLLFKFDPL